MRRKLSKITKSKRFWFSFIVFVIMVASFDLILTLTTGIDPVSLATGLTILGAPLYGYLIGETARPSGTVNGKKFEEPVNKEILKG